ncbi:MAG TPA: DUF1697 domain-containing protein [Kineosporiaceae bacterium]|nr:DUF1697 domain-containing protein [Kineosporiaceae bacterium]
MARYVALLRGVNVGKNKRIGMPALRQALADHGFQDVATMLVSGNAVLTPPAGRDGGPDAVAIDVERVVLATFGHDVRVVVRTADELAEVVAACPLPEPANGSRFMVAFLADRPEPGALADPEPTMIKDDVWWPRDREIYLWCPDGLVNSPAMAHLERLDLGVPVTVRNWNTVTKLAALADPERSQPGASPSAAGSDGSLL